MLNGFNNNGIASVYNMFSTLDRKQDTERAELQKKLEETRAKQVQTKQALDNATDPAEYNKGKELLRTLEDTEEFITKRLKKLTVTLSDDEQAEISVVLKAEGSKLTADTIKQLEKIEKDTIKLLQAYYKQIDDINYLRKRANMDLLPAAYIFGMFERKESLSADIVRAYNQKCRLWATLGIDPLK